MEIRVDIYKNRMILDGGGQTITVTPREPFTTARLLVGTFSADKNLRGGRQRRPSWLLGGNDVPRPISLVLLGLGFVGVGFSPLKRKA